VSIFLNYEGITGEASDSGHKGWIDVKNWQWGSERQITSSTSTQGDRESSNAVIRDLRISKYMDSSSPKIFIESCCGTGKTVKLRLTKTGKGSGADVFMEYTLKNALISYYDVHGSEHDTHRPIEEIHISFVDLEVKYTPYDEDGNAEAAIAVGFDTASNTKR
jgi:type VI secretion system secreted protein Hcp